MKLKRIAIVTIVFIGMALMAFQDRSPKKGQSQNLTDSKWETEKYEPIVVLELFTSQGCSSCPAADDLLEKVKNDFNDVVVPLSYHVDYWNYIGWQDPYSKSSFADKQRRYNAKFRNRSNYTPQMVVNGGEHLVGSNSLQVLAAIEKFKGQKAANKVVVSNVIGNKNSISFDFVVLGNLSDKSLRAVLVLDERITDVKRGENKNRRLKNSNIVVAEKSITIDESSSK
ncbi:MAG: DUF1223 domain-containing protein [Pricia sp.]|nr:DUF1223 domain-containing protein [Pricia sp.]